MLSRTCFVLSCRVLLFKLRFISCCLYFFFFQAEDGIRDYKVTGVQTCALPISTDALPHPELLPWFEPILSSNISVTWGARPHASRTGGPWGKSPTYAGVSTS